MWKNVTKYLVVSLLIVCVFLSYANWVACNEEGKDATVGVFEVIPSKGVHVQVILHTAAGDKILWDTDSFYLCGFKSEEDKSEHATLALDEHAKPTIKEGTEGEKKAIVMQYKEKGLEWTKIYKAEKNQLNVSIILKTIPVPLKNDTYHYYILLSKQAFEGSPFVSNGHWLFSGTVQEGYTGSDNTTKTKDLTFNTKYGTIKFIFDSEPAIPDEAQGTLGWGFFPYQFYLGTAPMLGGSSLMFNGHYSDISQGEITRKMSMTVIFTEKTK